MNHTKTCVSDDEAGPPLTDHKGRIDRNVIHLRDGEIIAHTYLTVKLEINHGFPVFWQFLRKFSCRYHENRERDLRLV
jgi:hypothetical protein